MFTQNINLIEIQKKPIILDCNITMNQEPCMSLTKTLYRNTCIKLACYKSGMALSLLFFNVIMKQKPLIRSQITNLIVPSHQETKFFVIFL